VLISRASASDDGAVLNWPILIGRAVALTCRGQQELVLENLALRQQLMAATWKAKRLRVRCVYSIGSRRALVLVQKSPETVATFQCSRSRLRPRRR
jgi:hypothetical protein